MQAADALTSQQSHGPAVPAREYGVVFPVEMAKDDKKCLFMLC